MSKLNELLEKYSADLKTIGKKGTVDGAMLENIAKSLGPSIYNRDSSMVACSDKTELERVKKNFLMGKLGMKDGPELDAALKSVCEEYDSNQKHRPVFYYLLAKKLGKKV